MGFAQKGTSLHDFMEALDVFNGLRLGLKVKIT